MINNKVIIDIKLVQKTARLAKLEFDSSELSKITDKIESVLKMINSLDEANTSEIMPLCSINEFEQKMRADNVSSYDISDDLFSNTNNNIAKELKCFVVPKVIE